MSSTVFDELATEKSSESQPTKTRPRTGGFWIAVASGLAFIGVASWWTGYEQGQTSRNQDVSSAEALGLHNTKVAIALGNLGMTDLVTVETNSRGLSEATLSLDPTNPNACRRALYVSADLKSITLGQTDAAGREFGRVTATNGQEAHQAMQTLCAPFASLHP